ncbi:hypothetical protein RB213_002729 [Colletotrichum asianum]
MEKAPSPKKATKNSNTSFRNRMLNLRKCKLLLIKATYKKLKKDIKGDANLKKIQELQGELNTLCAAANIITTPIRGQ